MLSLEFPGDSSSETLPSFGLWRLGVVLSKQRTAFGLSPPTKWSEQAVAHFCLPFFVVVGAGFGH